MARVWPLLALMLAVLLAVPPTGPSVEPVAARSWLTVGTDDSGGGSDGGGETDVAAGPESGSSDDSGGDSGGSAGAAPEVASGPSESSSDDSGGDGAGAAPEVESGPTDKPSDGGGDNGGTAEVAAAPGDKPSDGSPGSDVDIASAPGPDPAGGSASASDTPIPEMLPEPDGSAGETSTIPEVIDTGGARSTGNDASQAGSVPAEASVPDRPNDPAQPIATGPQPSPETGKSTVTTDRSGGPPTTPAADVAGQPPLPSATPPGQGADPAAGQAYYQRLLDADGAAADRLRSLDQTQLDQLTAQGPPTTAQQVIDLATGLPPAAPGTIEEYHRNQALRTWFENSRDHPADFDALAAALPPAERAELEQQFEEHKPGDLTERGGLSYWGRQASTFLREYNEQAYREHPSNFIPGSWPDRIERSGNKFIEGIPEGLATSVEHLLYETQPVYARPDGTQLIGETDEQYEQRMTPFIQDLKAMGQAYADDVKPIVTDGDWSKLGQRFHDDPVGAAAMYVPVAGGAAKLVSRTGGAVTKSVTGQFPGRRAPPAGKPAPGTPESAALVAGAPEGAAPASGAAVAKPREGHTPETGATAASAAEAAENVGGNAATHNLAPGARNQGAAGADVVRPSTRAPPTSASLPAAVPQLAAPTMPELETSNAVSGNAAIEAYKSGDMAKLAEELAPKPVASPSAQPGSVNAVGGTMNCTSCVIAGDSTLAGRPASAIDLFPGKAIPDGNQLIEAYAGAPWRAVSGREAIERELLAAGDGARGIVYGRTGGDAHVWNAVVQDGKVNFVDFQGHGPNGADAFTPWERFAFVRTK